MLHLTGRYTPIYECVTSDTELLDVKLTFRGCASGYLNSVGAERHHPDFEIASVPVDPSIACVDKLAFVSLSTRKEGVVPR
jgi:hypothetical protein